MLKNNIKTIISVFMFLVIPLIVSAKMGEMPSNISYFEMHWIDFIVLTLVLISTGYALLAAKIYGGIVGFALKFISAGLVGIVLYRVLSSFEHLGIMILTKEMGTILELIGFTLVAIGMYKLYTKTKKLTSGLLE